MILYTTADTHRDQVSPLDQTTSQKSCYTFGVHTCPCLGSVPRTEPDGSVGRVKWRPPLNHPYAKLHIINGRGEIVLSCVLQIRMQLRHSEEAHLPPFSVTKRNSFSSALSLSTYTPPLRLTRPLLTPTSPFQGSSTSLLDRDRSRWRL